MLVAQVDILETMTPLEFLSFRDAARGRERLPVGPVPAAGVRARASSRSAAIERFAPGTPRARRARAALRRADLWDAFLRYLAREGLCGARAALAATSTRADRAVAGAAGRADRRLSHAIPKHAELCERLVDLDEGLQEWRYRHVKMVERTIGTKLGTGGSSGASTWRRTLMTPLFPDLWAIRSRL